MKHSLCVVEPHQDYLKLLAQGVWRLETIRQIESILSRVPHYKKIVWDFSGVTHFDSAGVLLVLKYVTHFRTYALVELEGYSPSQEKMYRLLTHPTLEEPSQKPHQWLTKLGKATVENYKSIVAFITFLGLLFVSFFQALLHPTKLRVKEMVYHIHHSGLNALMIIGLTAFLVGMVIAYQGSVQLAKFGADIFIVDTVGISIVRELGPMITAIVIAGRSGSAYTAEIGAMKITEEISAMQTMGFDPYHFLVLPRVLALMIALPLLIFFSDLMGIFGGMVASKMQLGISYGQFTDRLYEVLELKHYLLGMLKGPVFAFIIATIGCFRGLQVSDNTESIGLHTTASVVNAIFLVIAFDALFSVLYTELGL